jgi:hypothetical protein
LEREALTLKVTERESSSVDDTLMETEPRGDALRCFVGRADWVTLTDLAALFEIDELALDEGIEEKQAVSESCGVCVADVSGDLESDARVVNVADNEGLGEDVRLFTLVED